jgi:hypothetical protein
MILYLYFYRDKKPRYRAIRGTKIQDRVDLSAPKLSTIKYLECENHVPEEFFLW